MYQRLCANPGERTSARREIKTAKRNARLLLQHQAPAPASKRGINNAKNLALRQRSSPWQSG
jgi:hypothetical protein